MSGKNMEPGFWKAAEAKSSWGSITAVESESSAMNS